MYRYTGNTSLKSFVKTLFTIPGFTYTFFFRLFEQSNFSGLKLIYKSILKILSLVFHFQIPTQTSIKKGFYIGHFGYIIINPATQIGKNVNIHQGVTIGQTNREAKKGVPIIGDKVWIRANSVIVGNIKIGNNVLIAPNSYVNIDIPDNSIAMGNPITIIQNNEATKEYICNEV